MAPIMLTTETYTAELRLDAIRKLAGRIKAITAPDDEVTEIASRKDAIVFSSVAKSDWTDADPKTPHVIDASNCMAAAEILRGLGSVSNDIIAKNLLEKSKEIIMIINNNAEVIVKPTAAKTSGTNHLGGTFV